MKIIFKELVEQITDYAIVVLDTKGFIQSWNAGAGALTGYTAREALGLPLSNLLHENLVHEAVKSGRASRQCWLKRKNGKPLWTDNVVQTVGADSDGAPALCWLCQDPFDT